MTTQVWGGDTVVFGAAPLAPLVTVEIIYDTPKGVRVATFPKIPKSNSNVQRILRGHIRDGAYRLMRSKGTPIRLRAISQVKVWDLNTDKFVVDKEF